MNLVQSANQRQSSTRMQQSYSHQALEQNPVNMNPLTSDKKEDDDTL